MLDRYLLEHELGAGARGVVYRARERDNGRQVAVKLTVDIAVLADCSAPDSQASQKNSRRTQLVHPSIPALYESGRAGHLRFEVFELVSGSNLSLYAEPATLLPLTTVLSIGAQIADAAHYAHQRGVIHGDIKPSNIMFDRMTGRAVLTDFPSESAYATTAERGAPAYRAPECLCGSASSPASDQFSLGVSLYRLVCGHHPFTGVSRTQIVHQVVAGIHTDPRVYVPSLPELLVDVFDTALAKEPSLRYSDVNAMKAALTRVEADLRKSACAGSQTSSGLRSVVR
jgi:serine/threonine-protein kinase